MKEKKSKRLAHSDKRFDEWAPTYEKGVLWKRYFLPLLKQFVEHLPDVKGMSVLDLGSGTGALAGYLSDHGAHVVGVDSSQGMLAEAAKKTEGRDNLEFKQGAAESIPLEDASVDLAVSSLALHHFEKLDKAFGELWRVLKPGAGLYICDMCGEGLISRANLRYGRIVGGDFRYYTRQELAKALSKKGFIVQEEALLRKIPPVMLLAALKPE